MISDTGKEIAMPNHRRRFTPEQKVSIVREHLIDRVSVSDLCDKHSIRPTVFYHWQKTMFENLPALFERKKESPTSGLVRENQELKSKLAEKDEVIGEIMADFIAAKKKIGGR
jgi:transposase